MSQNPSSSQTPFRIFLSHAGEDKETIARPLYRRLCEHGISVFLDVESFRLGEHSPNVMNHAMQTAPIGIFIMSPEFVAKRWTMRELLTFVRRFESPKANETPPLLITVFYRLTTRECRDPAIFYEYGKLFLECGLFKRAVEGVPSLKDVAHALDIAATLWSIENDSKADNSTRPDMAPNRESFVERVLDKILKRLRVERRASVNELHTSVGAQREQRDVYKARNNVPLNPPRLTLDYDDLSTCEGELKKTVLGETKSRIVAVVATGAGGVGKTCALKGLVEDKEVNQAFSGGILYIELGNDAKISDLIHGVANIVAHTGGLKLGREIKAADSVKEACDRASKWFESQKCLFLVDDIWKINGIDSNVLSTLEPMVNRNSRMVYTTRDDHFLSQVNKVIKFEAKEPHSEISRRMLLNHAGFEPDTVMDGKNKAAFEYFLNLCHGLPLGFGIVGGSVEMYSRHCSPRQDAWSEFHNHVLSKRKDLMNTEVAKYGKLPKIVDLSLEVLQKRNMRGKFDQWFRALCVVQKQQSVPAQMLQKLWTLNTLEEAETVVESFAGVCIMQMMRKDGLVSVKLHDLILDIASHKAAQPNGMQMFFRTLVRNYISRGELEEKDDWLASSRRNTEVSVQRRHVGNDNVACQRSERQTPSGMLTCTRFQCRETNHATAGLLVALRQTDGTKDTTTVQMADTLETQVETEVRKVVEGPTEQRNASLALCHAWWDAEDDGYLHNNVCRILRHAGYVDELLWLLSQPQWVVQRLLRDGLYNVEQDLEHGKAVCNNNVSQHADRMEHLEMLRMAVRLSAQFVNNNRRKEEGWFQIHGRLLWHATQSELTSEFLNKMEREAPRPWLKASAGLLHQAGRGALAVVPGPGHVLCMREEEDEIWILWSKGKVLHVGRYERTLNRYTQEPLKEEPLEEEPLEEKHKERSDVECASFSSDRRSVVAALASGRIAVWNRETGALERFVEHNCEDHKQFVDFCAEGTHIACEKKDHTIRLFDTLSGAPVGQPLEGHRRSVTCVVVSADGTRIVSGSDDGTMRVWDAQNGSAVGQPLECRMQSMRCVAVSADGTRIVSGSDDTVRVWDAQNGSAVGRPGYCRGIWTRCLAVSPDGTRIVSGSGNDDNEVRVWDAQNGSFVVLQGHIGMVRCVIVSADGTRIVSGSDDGTVRVWDAQNCSAVGQPLEGDIGWVRCVAVSADGTRIVSGSDDCTVRVWDAQSGSALGLPVPCRAISVGVSDDGNRIACDDNEELELWEWDGGAEAWKRVHRVDRFLGDPAYRALTWSHTSTNWPPKSAGVSDRAEDGSRVVLGTCENAVQNLSGGDLFFDGRFRSCRIIR